MNLECCTESIREGRKEFLDPQHRPPWLPSLRSCFLETKRHWTRLSRLRYSSQQIGETIQQDAEQNSCPAQARAPPRQLHLCWSVLCKILAHKACTQVRWDHSFSSPVSILIVFNSYRLVTAYVDSVMDAGFEQSLAACCGYGGGAYNFDFNVRCGDTGSVNGTEVLLGKSCENPSKRIIWDGIHFTEAANKWVFDRISDGKFSHPPNSLKLACRRAVPTQWALHAFQDEATNKGLMELHVPEFMML